MARIKKRMGKDGKMRYTVEIRLKGYPPQAATFSRLAEANLWIQETEVSMRKGKHIKTTESKKRTIEELIDKYKENLLPKRGRDKKTVDGELTWWKDNLGKYLLADITPQLLADYRDKLAKEPIKSQKKDVLGKETPKKVDKYRTPATIIRYLASLSVCFAYAMHDLGWIEDNPVLKVRKPSLSNERVRFLTDDEHKALLEACQKCTNPYLYIVVVLALSTGARMSEIMQLKWKDIDLQRKIMRLEQTKNKEKRAVPISSQAFKLIQKLNKIRRINSDYLFPRLDGKKPFTLKRHWQNAVELANLENFRFHDLRHTAASYLAMNGASLLEISHILGHKQLKMVKRYAHLTEQHTAGVLEKMNQVQFGKNVIEVKSSNKKKRIG